MIWLRPALCGQEEQASINLVPDRSSPKRASRQQARRRRLWPPHLPESERVRSCGETGLLVTRPLCQFCVRTTRRNRALRASIGLLRFRQRVEMTFIVIDGARWFLPGARVQLSVGVEHRAPGWSICGDGMAVRLGVAHSVRPSRRASNRWAAIPLLPDDCGRGGGRSRRRVSGKPGAIHLTP